MIDSAPMYGACEDNIGLAFEGRPPAGLKFTTKCAIGSPEAAKIGPGLAASLDASLKAMRLERAVALGGGFATAPWVVDRFCLYESHLSPKGSRYDELFAYEL